MGILNRKEKKDKKEVKGKEVKDKSSKKSTSTKREFSNSVLEDIIKKPQITEKATEGAENNVYVFEVADSANKIMIREAFKKIFEVSPVKIRTVNKETKERKRFGRKSSEKGMKKAYIYLKDGQEISIV